MSDRTIDENGWLTVATQLPSPNCDARPPGSAIELVVVHGISLPPGDYGGGFVQQFFQNRLDPAGHEYFAGIAGMRVSAHCLIERDGAITQFVSFADRAWHAGESSWRGRSRCNDFSVGIELEGCDDEAYADAQYASLAQLIAALRETYPTVAADAISGHSDIAPGRKTDPGPHFDWPRLKSLISD